MARINGLTKAIILFLLGIYAANNNIEVWFLSASFVVCLFLIVKSWEASKMLVFLLCILAGMIYANTYATYQEISLQLPKNTEVWEAEVVSLPIQRNDYTHFNLRLKSPHRGELKVITDQNVEIAYGDSVRSNSRITFWHNKPQASFPLLSITKEKSMRGTIYEIRKRFINNIKQNIGSDEGSLLAGITIGDKSGVSEYFRSQMNLAGTSHMTALSGYNVTVIIALVATLLKGKVSRKKQLTVSGVMIIFFLLATGGEPSITRAAMMGILLILANLTNRQSSFEISVALTAFVMTIWSPTLLTEDLAFQLSFLALLGIYYLEPIIQRFIKKYTGEKGEIFLPYFTTALSAQIAVLPILVAYFEKINILSVLTNAILAPGLPFLMLAGLLLGISGFIQTLGPILGSIMEPFAIFFIATIKLGAMLPNLTINNTFIYPIGIIYYAILTLLIYRKNQKQSNES